MKFHKGAKPNKQKRKRAVAINRNRHPPSSTVTKATPRQEYERVLHNDYGYPLACMDIEVKMQRGSSARERADLVIYSTEDSGHRDQASDIIGIVELKRRERKDGIQQLKSYMTASSCIWGVWTNGDVQEVLYKDPSTGVVREKVLFQVPRFGQPVDEVGTHSFAELRPATNLKLTFRRLLNELYTNTNISRREKLGNEMTKLLFCKLQDEQFSVNQPVPRFRASTSDSSDGFSSVRIRIDELFGEVKGRLAGEGVFDEHNSITLDDKALAYVVGELQGFSLTRTDEDVVGNAFEVFAESKFAGEKGEFFTPREVVRTAIRAINPRPGETIIDPACGSGGFLISALHHIWGAMETDDRWSGLTPANFADTKRDIARQTIYGLDKDSDLVRIAKAYMAIIGDGKSGIAHANSLHLASEFKGLAREHIVEDGKFKQFDIVLTNPPFGSKDTRVSAADSAHFDLGHKWSRKGERYFRENAPRSTPAQELFIERCLDLLRPGGRMAIVLPETYGHAPSKAYIRQYLEDHATINAVIDLPHNTFRPHCNAKTLLWIVTKNDVGGGDFDGENGGVVDGENGGVVDGENGGVLEGKVYVQQDKEADENSRIIFAAAEEMGRDHHGKIKYRIEDGHLTDVVWNDLPAIRAEWDHPSDPTNKNVGEFEASAIRDSIYVPRFYLQAYDTSLKAEAKRRGFDLVSIDMLIDEGALTYFRGHGAPPNQFKGTGDIPYVRVGDIGNWTIYRNPTAAVPRHVFESIARGRALQPEDLVFVHDGSYRIGDVGIVLPSDVEILLDSHCLVFRMGQNRWDIDGLELAYLLRHEMTLRQLPSKVFLNTTLPDIGGRWRSLRLPVARDPVERKRIRKTMRGIYNRRSKAEAMIYELLSMG